MIIHFCASARNIQEDLPYFDKIINQIHENEATVARNWLQPAYNRIVRRMQDDKDVEWREIFNENCSAISRSDAVIIEATNYNFNQGFYAAFSLEHSKPTLILTRNNPDERSFAGYQHEKLTLLQYSDIKELDQIIKDFIDSLKQPRKIIELKISSELETFLADATTKTDKTEQEILETILNNYSRLDR